MIPHDIHRLPVVLTRHAAERLALRFDMDAEDVRRVVKTARIIRAVRKEGETGILEGRLRRRRMRLVYAIREEHLVIVTVGEAKPLIQKCPVCGSRLKKGPQEVAKGVFVEAWACPKCKDAEAYMDLKQYQRYYEAVRRKAFRVGGSLAIRLPKHLAEELHIEEGTPVVFRREGGRLVIEAAEA